MRLIGPKHMTTEECDRILGAARAAGFTPQAAGPGSWILFGPGDADELRGLSGITVVEDAPTTPALARRGERTGTTVVTVGSVPLGERFAVIAGPCAVEDEARLVDLAHAVKAAGADMLRGGAFKPRTSPYSFRGLGVPGLEILRRAREETGLPIVTEVLDTRDVAVVAEHADMLQIGSRNMMNYALLVEAGRTGRPVLLKRGMGATVEETIAAAEYLLLEGDPDVVICERGIRTFNDDLRNTFDLAAIPVFRHRTHLPIIADPSHATGQARFVPAMARAAAAAGAAGVMLEVHDQPDQALSDGAQALSTGRLARLVTEMRNIAAIAAEADQAEEGSRREEE